MKRVLDSSVGFKWFVPEVDSDKALRLRDDYRNGIVELIAPDILLIEIAHALTRAERQRRITPAQGALALADMMSTRPQLFGYIRPAATTDSDFANWVWWLCDSEISRPEVIGPRACFPATRARSW